MVPLPRATATQQRSPTGASLTTSITLPLTSSHILNFLQHPPHVFGINPDISGFTRSSSAPDMWTLTNRIPVFFGLFHITATAIALVRDTADGVVMDVEAGGLGLTTRTRSTWVVKQATGESTVHEVFEVLSAPWGLCWFVLRTARARHKVLIEKMGYAWERDLAEF